MSSLLVSPVVALHRSHLVERRDSIGYISPIPVSGSHGRERKGSSETLKCLIFSSPAPENRYLTWFGTSYRSIHSVYYRISWKVNQDRGKANMFFIKYTFSV